MVTEIRLDEPVQFPFTGGIQKVVVTLRPELSEQDHADIQDGQVRAANRIQ